MKRVVLGLALMTGVSQATVDVVMVPKNLQKKYVKAADAAHKAGEAMATYCAKLGREIAQNQRTGEFGCLLLPPPEPDPSQNHAEKF